MLKINYRSVIIFIMKTLNASCNTFLFCLEDVRRYLSTLIRLYNTFKELSLKHNNLNSKKNISKRLSILYTFILGHRSSVST